MTSRQLMSLALATVLSLSVLQAATSGPGKGGVQFKTSSVFADITRLVGEEVCYTLTARDENGNVIRSWNDIGTSTTITLRNSSANTDSSSRSWNSDPEAYSWARITHNGVELGKITDNEWFIPATEFVDGVAEICLTHSKADTGVFMEITPLVPYLNQISQSVTFVADEITNYLVDVWTGNPATDAVYKLRPYEIIVVPRDRYLNYTDKEIMTRFTARWPGEFDSNSPGLANIFAGDVFIRGLTNYLIASRIEREKPTEPQWLMAYSSADPTIFGITDPYEVLSHEPFPFVLQTPVNHAIVNLNHSTLVETFTWERPNPPDPYWNIQVSQFSPTLVSDDIEYTWVIVDSASLTRAERILSNNNGIEAQLTLTHSQLWGVMQAISGQAATKSIQCLWYVDATDGLYTTKSTPSPGHYITIVANDIVSVRQPSAPSVLTLGQNYPNPFNPTTTLTFGTTRRGHVSLKVYDLLGSEVATIVNRELEAGTHSLVYDAHALRSGVYMYTLKAEGKSISRRMVVTK